LENAVYNVQYIEDCEYEANARYDYIAEAYAGEDLADWSAEGDAWDAEVAADEAAANGWHDAHVVAKRAHDAAVRIAASGAADLDIPF
jgi:hypothetical protein